ncbi:MAG: PHP domain-containing protein [Paenibacillaceae bacterium]
MDNITYVDLHTHTTASDGVCTPADNVRLALQAGLAAIAITDHDTVSGIDEARLEGGRIGIEVVPGVEISTLDRGVDVHILGYYINDKDPIFNQRLSQLRDTRNIRNTLILNRLNELGIRITLKEVNDHLIQQKSMDQTIGRPHIADVLIARGIVKTVAEAFELYLGKGGSAYINPPRISPKLAIDWIREAGGKAVLAHPGLYGDEEIVKDTIQHGIDGIEAYHSDHNEEQQKHYNELAARHELIVTAGSDFHGTKAGVTFHGAIGYKRMDTRVLELLKE